MKIKNELIQEITTVYLKVDLLIRNYGLLKYHQLKMKELLITLKGNLLKAYKERLLIFKKIALLYGAGSLDPNTWLYTKQI